MLIGLMAYGCAPHRKDASESEAAETRSQTARGDIQAGRNAEKRVRVEATAPEAADDQLRAAREKLRVSRETEERVQAEFEKLKASGQASAEVTKDYETYLERIRALVAENREVVAKLEAAMAVPAQNRNRPASGNEKTDGTAQLDRQLDTSLSEFDEMLLQEMDMIRAQSDRKMTSLAEEAAAAADRLRKKGIDVGGSEAAEQSPPQEDDAKDGAGSETAANEPSASRDGGETGQNDGASAEAGGGMTGSKQPGKETGGDAAGNRSPNRDSGYGEEDDDIVARQLREAAENETDPELKKKLWKEYEDYKKNTRN